MLLSSLVGCCSSYEFSRCGPPPARLVDVNSERGDAWGRNSYDYRTHELHPDHMRRYDYHPQTYHRFVHDEERG
jgi:hypothetical protein